ncbi:hypothetical protein HRJ45_21075 [Vibrio coralliilyticus]|uniref:hypothetical protein n=1 Tax=Vibrio coralliilyticus TaxID=190893 RepID=UPI00155FCC43|nr:hypothetical protein [Vibrio coralliilyticus]NRF27278.1 hypothetical protein [Vibrio coralliilyticus]NRF81608.1 hypothetical protein [Vibrio coralliilyticus]
MTERKSRLKPTGEACKASVYARYELLQRLLCNPNQAPAELIDACASQSALAALDLARHGITPLSRNSMYKYSDQVLAEQIVPEGKTIGRSGKYYLDWLRKQVMQAAIKETDYRTKDARSQRRQKRKEEYNDKLSETELHELRLSKAYLHLFQQIRSYVRDEQVEPRTRQRLFNLLNDHDALYGDLFSETGIHYGDNIEVLSR